MYDVKDFPADTGQGLERAAEDELAAFKLQDSGGDLHGQALDADLSVPGLPAGRFRDEGLHGTTGRTGRKGHV